jgi:hypothetical protein
MRIHLIANRKRALVVGFITQGKQMVLQRWPCLCGLRRIQTGFLVAVHVVKHYWDLSHKRESGQLTFRVTHKSCGLI